MAWQFIIGGLSLGVLSSFHCVGMCGPLSLALPTQYLPTIQRTMALLLYQFGRVITYSAFGFVFGLAGRGVYLAGCQRWFSIGMGILILVLLIHHWIFRRRLQPHFLSGFYIAIQRTMMNTMRSKRLLSFLFFGIANGFLPCGMVYMALAGALVTIEVYQSILFMASFGLGTLPAMMAVGLFKQFFGPQLRISFRTAIPVFISIMAVILILRGLNLGIPFISPVLQSASQSTISCP